jgi:hypothetical protein
MWVPEENWLPTSSYVEPVTPPGVEPDAAPQVQLCFSADWLPYILGCLAQLSQPTTWDSSDPATVQQAQDRAQALMSMFAEAGACVDVTLRIYNCQLQQSNDGGSTWATIAGWSTFTADCLPPPPPPNPTGASVAQGACNIATFLAEQVIQGALVSVVNSFNSSLTLAAATAAVLAIVPGWGTELAAAIDAAAGLYRILDSGNLSDFTTASTSAALAKELQCAVFGAISGAGEVTSGNYAAMAAAIHAIAYSPPDVQTAIDSYVSTLGAGGFLQAQLTGGLYVGDCSDCSAAWCWTIDFTVTQGGTQQYAYYSRGSTIYNKWVSGSGWESNGYNIGGDGFSETGFALVFSAAVVTSTTITYLCDVTSGGQARELATQYTIGGTNAADTTLSASAIPGVITVTQAVNHTVEAVQCVIRTNQNTSAQVITSVTLRGTGVSPFGSSNCT